MKVAVIGMGNIGGPMAAYLARAGHAVIGHDIAPHARRRAAAGADADTPAGALAAELCRRFVADEDWRGRDFSAMLPRFGSVRSG